MRPDSREISLARGLRVANPTRRSVPVCMQTRHLASPLPDGMSSKTVDASGDSRHLGRPVQ